MKFAFIIALIAANLLAVTSFSQRNIRNKHTDSFVTNDDAYLKLIKNLSEDYIVSYPSCGNLRNSDAHINSSDTVVYHISTIPRGIPCIGNGPSYTVYFSDRLHKVISIKEDE
jgi:hypothetical protein